MYGYYKIIQRNKTTSNTKKYEQEQNDVHLPSLACMHHPYHPSEYQDHRSSSLHINEFDDNDSKYNKDDDNENSKDYPDDNEAANV